MSIVLTALLTAGLAALAPGPDLRVAALGAQERAASPGRLRVRERREGNNCRASRLPVDVVPQTGPSIPPGPG